MAIISTFDGQTSLTVDPTSKAMHVGPYDTRGNTTSLVTSYSAGLTAKTATAAGTGVFAAIYGSSSKVVRVHRISVLGTVGVTAVYGDVVVKRVTAPATGGTATVLDQVPKDSRSGLGGCYRVAYFTVLATASDVRGVVACKSAFFPITTTFLTNSAQVIFDWTRDRMNEAPVLRGVSQGLELNFGTTTTNVPTLLVNFEWSEEN